MIMEICNNDLIIAIYSCKVGTCNKNGKKCDDCNKNYYNSRAVTKPNILSQVP